MPLQIIRQDITKMRVDAIVNTTNEEMIGYSGVDLAVHEAAGKELDSECARLAPLELGAAKITLGYDLYAKYVIHTCGPVWQGGTEGESDILRSCYIESLKLAVKHKCKSVAVPLISSGVYGYPKDKVLKFAVQIITEFLFDHEMMVYLCVFDRRSYEFSKKLFADISEFINDKYVEEHDEDCIGAIEEMEEGAYFEQALPVEEHHERFSRKNTVCSAPLMASSAEAKIGGLRKESLHDYMKSMDKSFAYKLFELIDKRGMTDVECYKKANVDKKTFSKIKCNPKTYKPSKQTAVAFAIALKLDINETQELLASAGLTLSSSFAFDKIIRYFIQNGVYDVFEINEALFEFDQVLLGV